MFLYHNRYIPYRNVICFLVEGGGITLSFVMANFIYYLNANVTLFSPQIIYKGVLIAFFAQFCMFILDLYDLKLSLSIVDILISVTFTTGLLFVLMGVFILFSPAFGITGEVFYLTGLFIFMFLFGWRFLLERYIGRHSPTKNILILGDGKNAKEVADLIKSFHRYGLNFAGYISKQRDLFSGNPGVVLDWDDISRIETLKRKERIHEIVVAPEDRRTNIPIKKLLELKIKGVQIVEWPEFYERLAGKIPGTRLTPSFFVFNEGFTVSRITKVMSRILSFIISLIALALFLPLLLVISILTKIDSKGPVFYVQERVGENGRKFKLFKLRTMVENAEEMTGAVWAINDDPRITNVGKWLRRYRLDEFPQFFNVLKGEMNLVGPRPERPEFVEELVNELPYYSLRLSIKPGITGWAQVKYSYSGTIEESREKLDYELFYLKNRSFKLDCYIILQTIKIMILGRGSV